MINVYIGNLPYSAADEDLRKLFSPFGQVASAQVIIDRRSRRSRGYGFVEMESEVEGRKAIESLNDTEFMGRQLRVDESKPREKRDSGPDKAQQPAPGRPAPAAGAGTGGVRGFLRRLFG